MNILVTGGIGYIGSHTVIELLKDKNNSIIIIDNLINSRIEVKSVIEKISGRNIKFYNIDLTSFNEVNEIYGYDEEILLMQATMFYYKGQIKESKILLSECLFLNRESVNTLINIGIVSEEEEKRGIAKSYYEVALEKSDDNEIKSLLKGKIKNRFSIIIPAHNAEGYIEECITSVLKQTFKDYEIIVVNDASNDSTEKKLIEMGVNYINTDVSSAGLARNVGLDKATGEYILFLDSDDYYINENALDILNKNIDDEDIIHFRFMIGTEQAEMFPKENVVWPACWCKCWKRSFIGDSRFKDITPGEDLEFYERLANGAKNIFVDEVLVQYRYPREGSIMYIHNNLQNK